MFLEAHLRAHSPLPLKPEGVCTPCSMPGAELYGWKPGLEEQPGTGHTPLGMQPVKLKTVTPATLGGMTALSQMGKQAQRSQSLSMENFLALICSPKNTSSLIATVMTLTTA